jgi:hypothetical protein
MIIEANVITFLYPTQEVETNIKVLAVEHTVGIADAMAQNLLPQQLRSILYLNQSIVLGKSLSLAVNDALSLSSSPIRGPSESVSQSLYLIQDAILEENFPSITHTLTLTQHAEGIQARPTFDTLELADEVTLSMTINPLIEHTLIMNSSSVGYLPSKNWFSFDFNVME